MIPKAIKLGARLTLVRFRCAAPGCELVERPHNRLNTTRTVTAVKTRYSELDGYTLQHPRKRDIVCDDGQQLIIRTDDGGYRCELSYRVEPASDAPAEQK